MSNLVEDMALALEEIVRVGTKTTMNRVGDMWDLEHGYDEIEVISEEARIAASALSAYREGEEKKEVHPGGEPTVSSSGLRPELREAYEDHPCGLCDTAGRCTFACEEAELAPPPAAVQMLILAEAVLDDLSEPDPTIRRLDQLRHRCSVLRDEIRRFLPDGPTAQDETPDAVPGMNQP